MKLTDYCINNRVVTMVLTFVLLGGGFICYNNLSRLEDPEFTIKDALIITPYPGATPAEVEQEVSDTMELALQQLGQLDSIESRSERGVSTITATIKDKYDKHKLPQVWDELRRKVNDAVPNLPPGAGTPMVIDDYGDVFGIFLVVYGQEYSYAEIRDFVKILQKELPLVEDVAKVSIVGLLNEVIYVEFDRDLMASLGIPKTLVIKELQLKNIAAFSGRFEFGTEYITINPSGLTESVDSLGNIYLTSSKSNRQIRLKDIAKIRRAYQDPATQVIRFNGEAAIGIGISTVSGGNVVTMGEKVKQRLHELKKFQPLGMEIDAVSFQSDAVTTAIDGFVVSLLQAVAIVIVVLMFFMGLRSAVIIGFVLMLTISATFMIMLPNGVALERISLGALIIALGMLVDNAIVIVDSMLIKIQQGEERKQAAIDIVKQTAMPLLGATIVAILAFAAIGTSQDSTGEFCRSLYQVVLYSLLLSWFTAVTVTPLLCIMFLKAPDESATDGDQESKFVKSYKGFLNFCLRRRWAVSGSVFVMFALSVWGFGFVDQSFFPDSTRPQLMVDVFFPRGTHIEETKRKAAELEDYLSELDTTTNVTSLIGKGAPRFLLTYAPEKTNSAYIQFIVDVKDYRTINSDITRIEEYIENNYPNATTLAKAFILGPGGGGKIQTRIYGDDPDAIRSVEQKVMAVMDRDPISKGIRSDWMERVKVYRPILNEDQVNKFGLTYTDISRTIHEAFDGETIGVFRENDELLPIISRAAEQDRRDISQLRSVKIWSPSAGAEVPITQFINTFELAAEDEIIIRDNRRRCLTVHCDQRSGSASTLFKRLRPQIEAIEMPPGCYMEWGGEYEDSGDAQAAMAGSIPMFALIMVLIVIMIFNSIRQPAVIFICVPLAIIGVTIGLLCTGQPFGFMALLGFLSLSGMLIKAAIVLIDQINLELSQGNTPYNAIIDSCVSRLRPVMMAALTTALGMMPLLGDAFFVAMAVTIIFGLMFATVLIMVIVPVVYAILFRIAAVNE